MNEALEDDTKVCERRSYEVSHELSKVEEDRKNMEEEKEERLILMQYIDALPEELDSKMILLQHFDTKIQELEKIKDNYVARERACTKEYENLSQGKVMELPEHILKFLEESDITIIYGMEWLQKNGRSVKENQELVKTNPFLPYSIIISENDRKKLAEIKKEIYTNFPIPVMVREELEEKVTDHKGILLTLEKINFFVMFNSHLLDAKALELLLKEKKQQLEEIKNKIQTKKEEIQEYNSRRNMLENQKFTLLKLEEAKKKIEELKEETNKLQSKLDDYKEQKKELTEKIEKLGKQIEQSKSVQKDYDLRKDEFTKLSYLYKQYEENMRKKVILQKKQKESEETSARLEDEYRQQQNAMESQKLDKQKLEALIKEHENELTQYNAYEKSEKPKDLEHFDYTAAKIRYQAITQGFSANMKELKENLNKEEKRYQEKSEDLKHKNKYDFPLKEYKELLYSKEAEVCLEKQIKELEREVNAATEANITISNQIASLEEKIRFSLKELQEKAGLEEPLEKKVITDIEFTMRRKLALHELEQNGKRMKKLWECLNAFENTQAAMADYMEFKISGEVIEYSIESYTKEELLKLQGELRSDYQKCTKNREGQKQKTKELIQKTAAKECYKDEFFQKGFLNLLSLTEDVNVLKEQLETTLASYKGSLEKLQVDLENIAKERASLEETFLDYIKDVNEHMARIDKNSSVTIRERSIKMLKITVPSWEDNKELYQVRVRDFVSSFIQMGMNTIEQDQNIEEFLGKVITTKSLYDEVIGMSNVGVRLYKIEAEREVPISWAEVSANSGGEGFLSAFVILSSLLSYMRRDETDLFAMGEEGKVLLMDNPFAQTNAEHLLKPLTDMAKKTNTQLICLSGIGGDSVYNRFDNIYVLKLVSSTMKKGMRYLKSNHLKGNDIQKMELSRFTVEQGDLFEFMEE